MTTPIPFHHAGSDYEVRCASDGNTIRVRAFKNGLPADGYEYSVTIPTAFDWKNRTGVDAAEVLIEDAKRHVVEGTWEKYLTAMAEIESREKKG